MRRVQKELEVMNPGLSEHREFQRFQGASEEFKGSSWGSQRIFFKDPMHSKTNQGVFADFERFRGLQKQGQGGWFSQVSRRFNALREVSEGFNDFQGFQKSVWEVG